MQNKETKTIINIYAALTVSLLLSFLPIMSAAALATIMFLGVLVVSYSIRKKADHTSLTANHMTFIIRTIWIMSFFGIFTMGLACFYILNVYDPSAIQACADTVLGAVDQASIQVAIAPCMEEFMSVNMTYFINGLMIGAGPLVIYFAYRLAKGLSRAIKGHRIGDVKNWF